MEKDKNQPLGEFEVNADITLTYVQLQAIVWFYGKETPLSQVIDSITAMPEESRENFMDQLVQRYNNPPNNPDEPPQE